MKLYVALHYVNGVFPRIIISHSYDTIISSHIIYIYIYIYIIILFKTQYTLVTMLVVSLASTTVSARADNPFPRALCVSGHDTPIFHFV